MADEAYCSVEDVFRYATSRGGMSNAALEVSSVSVTDNALTVEGHNLELDAKLEAVAFPGGFLPAPLLTGVTYFAIPDAAVESRLRLAATAGGPAIDLTSSGSMFGLRVSIRETIMANIKAASQRLHRFLPAHAVPLTVDGLGKYPETARHMTAVWAAHATFIVLGQRNLLVKEEAESLFSEARLLLAGVGIRDTKQLSNSANVAIGSVPSAGVTRYVP